MLKDNIIFQTRSLSADHHAEGSGKGAHKPSYCGEPWKTDMNDIRQQFWTEVFVAHASKHAFSLREAVLCADEALRALDELFPTPNPEITPHDD